MQQQKKRSWIYSGIAHPPGVALAKPRQPQRLPPGSRLLLAGDRHAKGLAAPLKHLCRDRKVAFETLFERAPLDEWAAKHLLRAPVADLTPTIVAVSLFPAPASKAPLEALLRSVAADGRHAGATLLWLRPPVPGPVTAALKASLQRARVVSFHSEALPIPRGPDGETPTAAGYAGWAGALLSWIG